MDLIDETALGVMEKAALEECDRLLTHHQAEIACSKGDEKRRFHADRHEHWREIRARIPALAERFRRSGVESD